MGELAGQREHIAKLLVKTLEMIEHETGIFLIKPIMSVPSKLVTKFLVDRRLYFNAGHFCGKEDSSNCEWFEFPLLTI